MNDPPPPILVAEREALIREIELAFDGVSRKGGVSWSEADAIDGYGSPEECEVARARDGEGSWNELIDDPKWNRFNGISNWSFLDAIGFRYYLPVAMIRSLRAGENKGIVYSLTIMDGEWRAHALEQLSALDLRQRRCVKRFLQLMIAYGERMFEWESQDETDGDVHRKAHRDAHRDWYCRDWQTALDSYWNSVPDEASSTTS